jgi:hypothetical protein
MMASAVPAKLESGGRIAAISCAARWDALVNEALAAFVRGHVSGVRLRWGR